MIILDVWLPDMNGVDVLQQVLKLYPELPVIVISGHANIELAVRAVKLGAFDFLEKPISLARIISTIRNAFKLDRLKRENLLLRSIATHPTTMLGNSPAMEHIRRLIGQCAASDARILITGENGVGKELVAREIHNMSARAFGPFIEMNCAAIPDTLIESELFGHEKGAFTGAVSARKGKFELADGGTLFFDEVADMSLLAQAKVLRAIQEMRMVRVGGEEPVEVNVRVVAATNQDIDAALTDGRFREDLFFRLDVVRIEVPPLRERLEDLSMLLDEFLKVHRQTGEATSKHFDAAALRILHNYSWPGNIRELKNFVERVTILNQSMTIGADAVREYLIDANMQVGSSKKYSASSLTEARATFEREYISRKLHEHNNNISHTAQALGIYPSSLHAKIRKLGITVKARSTG